MIFEQKHTHFDDTNDWFWIRRYVVCIYLSSYVCVFLFLPDAFQKRFSRVSVVVEDLPET